MKSASKVFEANFRFDSKNAKADNVSANCLAVVEIPDVEAAAFKVMLSFIYADDLNELNGDNAMAVLYAADKYNIPDLVVPSLQIPFSELRNVFLAYAQARLFELEDYCNDCLDYIDGNADALLKSDGFLQIDQKLLCEILERDQLQITENRRQMLGSALFKIRLPLLAHNEFTVQIVSSGILIVEEVVGIKQYHSQSKMCGSSGGLLYGPLQFPSHWRNLTFGTIVLDIEKVSEFAGEKVGTYRYSETAQIRGLSWNIVAKINAKNGSTDQKWLGIYIKCAAAKEGMGWHKLRMSLLGNEIEKVSEFAREVIGSERKSETVHIKGFPWEIVAQINPKIMRHSKPIGRRIYNEKWLGIYLLCVGPKNDKHWSFKCSLTCQILSQKSGLADYKKNGPSNGHHFFSGTNGRGFSNFISFAQLMDSSNGFYDQSEDKVKLAIDFNVKDEDPGIDDFFAFTDSFFCWSSGLQFGI
ncbi:hypothetical protein niasHT_003326 [Heterodera trifolii]|uniref:MATH domain-containing protein n=1 Tax=Heterodera trifolii TaxID=157864 RepID=A0ABD2LXY4_9BILA